jgi:predicted site-specific integrase-resolvase
MISVKQLAVNEGVTVKTMKRWLEKYNVPYADDIGANLVYLEDYVRATEPKQVSYFVKQRANAVYTLDEACEILKISRSTMYRRIQETGIKTLSRVVDSQRHTCIESYDFPKLHKEKL